MSRFGLRKRTLVAAIAVAFVMWGGGTASAVVDSYAIVLDTGTTTFGEHAVTMGAMTHGAHTYDPTTDTLWICGYGSTGSMYPVTSFSTSPTLVDFFNTVDGKWYPIPWVSPNDWTMYDKNGNATWSQGNPTPGGLLINTKPIYTDDTHTTELYPAYGSAVVADAVGILREYTGGPAHPEMTPRIYLYNMQAVSPSGTYGDGRDVFSYPNPPTKTTLVSLADLNVAGGALSTNTTSNLGRQPAWSSDGQLIYFNDASSTLGGIYRVLARDGTITRIFQNRDINTEPWAIHTSVRDFDATNATVGDQIVVRGTSSNLNAGGLDYIIDDGSATAAGPFTLISAAKMNSILEWNGPTASSTAGRKAYARMQLPDGSDPGPGTETPGTFACITTNAKADGTLYFGDSGYGAMWRYDNSNRLAVILSKIQQQKATGGTSGQVLRTQNREVTHPNGFPVTQLIVRPTVNNRQVALLYDFKTGDFNRDGVRNSADVVLFKAALATPIATFSYTTTNTTTMVVTTWYFEGPSDGNTPPGQLETTDPVAFDNYLKFDLSGNGLVTDKDRAVLLPFVADTDDDGDVDLVDFGTFQNCFNGPNRTPRQADCDIVDFDLDGDVDLVDFGAFQTCFNGPNRPPKC